ncbi:MAG: penicillin-binding transpeptidase domain-containing protein, partial [Anaerolineales bacterium]
MSKLFILFLALLWSLSAAAEDQVLAGLFSQQRLDGTIVISSLHNGNNFIHNDLRANQRFPIASTFKIMNTLIAVEENAISGKDEVLKWDGNIYDFPDWNHDQTLE